MHTLGHISNLDGLESYLRNWSTFSGDETVHDTGGMFVLLMACLDNLERNGTPGDFESLGNYMDKSQRKFLLELATFVRDYEEKGLGTEFENDEQEVGDL